jgi:leucyl/phenylalanyl-tRNA--protein transferase
VAGRPHRQRWRGGLSEVPVVRQDAMPELIWLDDDDPFPPTQLAWGTQSDAPGLLAAGGDLTLQRLEQAYRHGIYPWFSPGQPVLWWSPDPRMVLKVAGTWILPQMVQAYRHWHAKGRVHSVETWIDGELAGGLYGVAIGRMFFGESMFSWRSEASKIALAALVCFCRAHGITLVDCQQNTGHLASLGARPIDRAAFEDHLSRSLGATDVADWTYDVSHWTQLDALRESSNPL